MFGVWNGSKIHNILDESAWASVSYEQTLSNSLAESLLILTPLQWFTIPLLGLCGFLKNEKQSRIVRINLKLSLLYLYS